MDDRRFEAAIRMLGQGANRRQALAGALGALFGGGLVEAAAKARGKNRRKDGGTGGNRDKPGAEGPCGDGSRTANLCTKDKQCCTGYCKKKGLKNKDGSGRCRCLKRGKACKADKNCCGEMTCVNGACANGGQASTSIPNGGACTQGGLPCADPNASCREYKSWANGPAGTYCLLDVLSACSAATDCTVNSCYRGACVACSCKACATVSCASPTVASGGNLQAAIAAAASGDVITIAPGTYTGDFSAPNGTTLTLAGCPANGNEVILVNQNYGSRTLTLFGSGKLDLIDVVVQGYNNPASFQYGGGVQVKGELNLCARTVVRNNFLADRGAGVSVSGLIAARGAVNVYDHTIIENNSAAANGGGLSVDSYTDGLVTGLAQVLTNASTTGGGGGLWAEPTAVLTINGEVLIDSNTAKTAGGGVGIKPDTGLSQDAERLTIGGDVVISGNSSDSYGSGVGVLYDATSPGFDLVTIKDNVQIKNNINKKYGGGGVGSGHAHIVIKDKVKITGNSVDGGAQQRYGGGIAMLTFGNANNATLDIEGDVEISGCAGVDYGGGIYLKRATLNLKGNAIVTGNTVAQDGGGVYADSNEAYVNVTENAKITGNTAGRGGGIYGYSGAPVTVVSGSVTDNTPNNCAGSATC